MITKLTHANTKQEIFVVIQLIFSSYYSEATKCTHVLSTGGAIIPVLESPEKVSDSVKKYYEGVKNEVQRKAQGAN